MKKDGASDWCPLEPGQEPPRREGGLANAVGDLFSGWRSYLGVVSIAGLVLAYSVLMVPPPLATETSVPESWGSEEPQWTPMDRFKWIRVPRPDTNITEQTVFDGDTVLEFRDQTVSISGLMLFKDDARLVLRNCTLIAPEFPGSYLENIYNDFAGMVFNDTARLEAYDSTIVPSHYMDHIGFMGSSSCYLENTLIANHSLCFDESATLEARGSTVFRILADRSSELRLVDSYVSRLVQGNWWRSQIIDPSKEPDTTAVLENSTLSSLSFRVVNGSLRLDSDPVGRHVHWSTIDLLSITSHAMNVTLINSELAEPLAIDLMNSDISVTGVDVYSIRSITSNATINDSIIYYYYNVGDSRVAIKDSFVKRFVTEIYYPYLYPSSVSRNKCRQEINVSNSSVDILSVTMNADIAFSNAYVNNHWIGGLESSVRGSVTWGPKKSNPYDIYDKFSVKQEYTVVTQGRERVVRGVNLVLKDKDGNVVWEGESDESGRALFNITFCSYYPLYEPYKYVTNYDDEWVLTATRGDAELQETIAFLTTPSPIVFEFPTDEPTLPVENLYLTYGSLLVIFISTVLKLRNHI
ncbi:hypothetical protein JXL21_02165 [Candidatus Bathyarchaeota archaeon]|nr:hypothetical protein [Candidatus Bathyarchaeota archaeon]